MLLLILFQLQSHTHNFSYGDMMNKMSSHVSYFITDCVCNCTAVIANYSTAHMISS